MNICIVALGKIGLPLAVQCAWSGHTVRGADINRAIVDQVNAGIEPFPGEADLAERLRAVVDAGRLTATTDTAAAVAESEAVIVVVPLMVDDEGVPDFRAMDAATSDIARSLRPGTLVNYETTLPLGTTRNRFAPALVEGSGLTLGEDLFVCHSPERVYSGRIFADLRRYPKLVGGIDAESARRAVSFYEQILQFDDRPELSRPNGVWDLGSAEAAEFAKLAETTYRDVNIALANTFARTADAWGVDVYKVIEASNSQPFSHIHQPGIAVGGHCIPVYPRFYLSNDPGADVVRTARACNEGMPAYAVDRLIGLAGDLSGRRTVVLGAAYRGGVKETAFSGVFATVDELRSRGATVLVHDPLYTDEELADLGFDAYHLGEPVDAAVVQTDHAEYRELDPESLPGCRAVVDGRRALDPERWLAAGVAITAIGRSAAR